MTNDSKTKKNHTTCEGRVSYPNVFTPQEGDYGTKYNLSFLIPKTEKDEIKKLKALMLDAAYEKWGKEAVDAKKFKINFPLKDGDEKAEEGKNPEYTGHVYFSASTKNAPKVVKFVGIEDGKKKYEPIDEASFYAGCFARISTNAYAYEVYDKKTKKVLKRGVSFGLNNVLKTRDGERFGGGSSSVENDFDEVEVEVADDDYGNAEDDIFGNDD